MEYVDKMLEVLSEQTSTMTIKVLGVVALWLVGRRLLVPTSADSSPVVSENSLDFSTNELVRVDLVAQIAHDVCCKQAIELLKNRLPLLPNVLSSPAPEVHVLSLTLAGPVVAVRPHTHSETYWDVYFATNKLVRELFDQAKSSVPEQLCRLDHGAS